MNFIKNDNLWNSCWIFFSFSVPFLSFFSFLVPFSMSMVIGTMHVVLVSEKLFLIFETKSPKLLSTGHPTHYRYREKGKTKPLLSSDSQLKPIWVITMDTDICIRNVLLSNVNQWGPLENTYLGEYLVDYFSSSVLCNTWSRISLCTYYFVIVW